LPCRQHCYAAGTELEGEQHTCARYLASSCSFSLHRGSTHSKSTKSLRCSNRLRQLVRFQMSALKSHCCKYQSGVRLLCPIRLASQYQIRGRQASFQIPELVKRSLRAPQEGRERGPHVALDYHAPKLTRGRSVSGVVLLLMASQSVLCQQHTRIALPAQTLPGLPQLPCFRVACAHLSQASSTLEPPSALWTSQPPAAGSALPARA
jgi:hypothetical protein